MIFGIAYFIFSSPLSFFFVWRRLRKDPLWRGYDLRTRISGVLAAILLLFLAWIGVAALRLYSPAVVPTGQTAPAR